MAYLRLVEFVPCADLETALRLGYIRGVDCMGVHKPATLRTGQHVASPRHHQAAGLLVTHGWVEYLVREGKPVSHVWENGPVNITPRAVGQYGLRIPGQHLCPI